MQRIAGHADPSTTASTTDGSKTLARNIVAYRLAVSVNSREAQRTSSRSRRGRKRLAAATWSKAVPKTSIAKSLDVSRSFLHHFIETRKIVSG